jgi:hypothetical protein
MTTPSSLYLREAFVAVEPRNRKRNRWDNEFSSQEEARGVSLGVWGCDHDPEEGEITP